MAGTDKERDAAIGILKEGLESEALRKEELRKRRKRDNLELTDRLRDVIEGHPELRFGQIITSLFVGDDPDRFYYDEPSRTLEILEGNMDNISNR